VGTLAEWLSMLRDLHERARRGSLGPGEEARYRSGRDELSRVLVAAQRLTLKPGETPRQALRVTRALHLEISLSSGQQRAVTVDVSTGGLSTLLPAALPLGEELSVALRLPASGSLSCQARVTDARPEGKQYRVAARFVDLAPADRERLEVFVLDTALAQLAG